MKRIGFSAGGKVAAGVVMMALGAATAQVAPSAGGATAASASAPGASSKAASSPAGPTVNVAVTNWTIFVTDVSYKELNRRESFSNTLPPYINDSRREPEPAGKDAVGDASKDVLPIGVVRLAPDGPVNSDAAIDVELSFKSGRVLGNWPPGKSRSAGVLWRDVHFAGAADKARELPEGSWLSAARGGVGGAGEKMIAVGNVADSFLLYDVELQYPVTLQVTGGEKGIYQVAQGTEAPMRDLTLYKKDGGGWRSAMVASMEKSGPVAATKPTTIKAATSAPASTTIPRGGSAEFRRVTSTSLAEAVKPEPPVVMLGNATEMTLSGAGVAEDKVLAPWKSVLAKEGVSPADQELIIKILAKHALDPKRLTAIYRMDSAELEKVLPLEIVPQPTKTSRIALVVVTGIDPSMDQELAECISQLGNPSWEKREAAMTEIKKLGMKAKPLLEKAAKDKDVEVVYRAEQLLQMLNPDGTVTQGGN